MNYHDLKHFITNALDISSGNLNELAQAFSRLYQHFQTDAIQQVTVESVAGTCFNWVRSRKSNPQKVMLFFHGGGYTMGNTLDHLELIAQLVLKTDISVLSVDYRLAPESVFRRPWKTPSPLTTGYWTRDSRVHRLRFQAFLQAVFL